MAGGTEAGLRPFTVKQILDEKEGFYEGEVDSKGRRHGYGVQTYPSGQKYEGYWVEDGPHGTGNLSYPNGDMYFGEVKNGKRDGYGTLTLTNGNQ